MTGYSVVNLMQMVDELGEGRVKDILSTFSCPLSLDVEQFLRYKAIDFATRSLSQTHLVATSYKGQTVIARYFTLASKYIAIPARKVSGRLKKRVQNFSGKQDTFSRYNLAVPLIAQLGKNFTSNYNELMSGDELLTLALKKISRVQMDLGGRFAYLECEDKPKLIEFYERHGFIEFDKRDLDKDERDTLHGNYLVQMLKYIEPTLISPL